MSTILRAVAALPTLASPAETEILTVTIPLLRLDQPVTAHWLANVATPAAGTTRIHGRLRRGGPAGVLVNEIRDLANIANNPARLYDAIAPAFDSPGQPATVTYAVTLEMVGGTGASSGVRGFLYVTYN